MYFAYAMMCLIFGTTFLAIKIGVDAGVPPFIFAGTRFLAAGILIILFFRLTGKQVRLSRQELRDACFVGISMTTVLFATLYWGERYISSGLAALLSATAPMIVGAVQWRQGSKSLLGMKLAGLCLGLIGVGTAVFPALNSDGTLNSMVAVVFILLAQVTYSIGAVHSKRALVSGTNPYIFNAYQMLFGSAGLILLSVLLEPWQTLSLNSSIIKAWLYLTVLGSIVGHGTYYWLVRATNPLFPSTWTYISPIIAQFVGYWWLGETISFRSLVGLALVLLGLLLINRNVRTPSASISFNTD
ncbi:MAG: EamA family transporter [Clostridia bacterium]|nr:EamA family transporter [Clostridia bacterium]